MKTKGFVLGTICMLAFNFAIAQNVAISGEVKNEAGAPLPLAMVEVKDKDILLKTDEQGNFSLSAEPKAKLIVSCVGYLNEEITVGKKTNLLVVLKSKQANGSTADDNAARAFSNYGSRNGLANSTIYGSTGNSGTSLPVFTHTEDTRGSRYVTDGWIGGMIIGANDSIISNPKYHYNYDKINGSLLMSQDDQHAIEINKEQVKGFVLNMPAGQAVTYQYVPEIDKTHYVQVIAKSPGYNVYKYVTTKFVKNNYQSSGLTSAGNNYDEYVDEPTYYLADAKSGKITPIALKKKSIKEAFGANGEKVEAYTKAFKSAKVDDVYLQGLVDYVSKN